MITANLSNDSRANQVVNKVSLDFIDHVLSNDDLNIIKVQEGSHI